MCQIDARQKSAALLLIVANTPKKDKKTGI